MKPTAYPASLNMLFLVHRGSNPDYSEIHSAAQPIELCTRVGGGNRTLYLQFDRLILYH